MLSSCCILCTDNISSILKNGNYPYSIRFKIIYTWTINFNRKLKSGHQTCSTKFQIPYSQKIKVNDIFPKQY